MKWDDPMLNTLAVLSEYLQIAILKMVMDKRECSHFCKVRSGMDALYFFERSFQFYLLVFFLLTIGFSFKIMIYSKEKYANWSDQVLSFTFFFRICSTKFVARISRFMCIKKNIATMNSRRAPWLRVCNKVINCILIIQEEGYIMY